jgi:hypothetical protein
MKIPLWLTCVVLCPVVLGIGAGVVWLLDSKTLQAITNVAVILTLGVLMVYTYYTYLLASDAWTPSASFTLTPYPNDPYHFAFLLQNHCKLSLQCWCNLHATVCGQPIALGGFYNGETSFDIQPFGVAMGHFDLSDILSRANRTLEEMKEHATSRETKQQLYLNIEFWYNAVGSTTVVHNPKQPNYFDFTRDAMVTDF